MHRLQSGVAFSVIALWFGHESTTTTDSYVEANPPMKGVLGQAQRTRHDNAPLAAPDDLVKFLQPCNYAKCD